MNTRIGRKTVRIALPLLCGLGLMNCGPKPTLHPDYANRKPTVVLVLPPENTLQATEVEETAYPIIYEKLTNRGYYCISPELARGIFNANKLEDAGRINALPPQKLKEIFGADAVLRVRVLDWTSKYIVISSTVTIKFEMTLVDASTGEDLWSLTHVVSKSPSGNSGGGLVGALIEAAVHAAMTPYEPIADENAGVMLSTLPEGTYRTGNPR
jgi:hypothetical protein